MSIALCHNQTVLVSLEEVSLIQHFVITSSEISLPLHIDKSAPLIHPSKPGCFLLVSVEIDNQGKPECLDLILRKSIEIRLRFQVVEGCSVLLPLKVDLELQLYRVVLLFYGYNFEQSQRHFYQTRLQCSDFSNVYTNRRDPLIVTFFQGKYLAIPLI